MDLGSLPCACGLAARPRRPFGITKSTAEAPRSGAGLLAQGACGLSAGTAPATLRLRGRSLIQGAAAGRVSKGGNTQSARSHPSRRALRALLRVRPFACDGSNSTGKTLVDQAVELAGVLAGDLMGDVGRQVAELLGDVFRGIGPDAVGMRIVGAPHQGLDAHILDQLGADAVV